MTGWNNEFHKQDLNSFFLLLSLGPIVVAHKPGSFLKPPGPPVQHEVKVQDGPSQPQPLMTISRSQSPLPPVDWKTYTSSSRKLRPPTPSSSGPRSESPARARTPREMAPFLRYKKGMWKCPPKDYSQWFIPQDKGNNILPQQKSHISQT